MRPPRPPCRVPDCDRPARASGRGFGWCELHWRRVKKHGDPYVIGKGGFSSAPPEERFWPNVNKTESCWLWTAALSSEGYGVLGGERVNGRNRYLLAHRFAYEVLVGPIPDGMTLDHLCRVRHCCNPNHLEPVTQRVNTLRGVGPSALNAVKTHCKHGHELTPENTRVDSKTGHRACWTCMREHTRAYNATKSAEARARLSQPRSCEGCNSAFVPRAGHQRFCTSRCRQAARYLLAADRAEAEFVRTAP